MNTILTVFLQISGGLRTEVNSFLSEYAVPVIAMLLIVGDEIEIVCEGEDEDLALESMVKAIESGLGE